MKLSTKSRYAIEGLVYIAIYSPNEAIRIKQIAEDTGITVAYLEQIFFLLKKAGLLLTVRGAKGGFLLAQSPKDITVGMVLRAIEHDLAPVKCVHDLESCTSKVRSSCVNRQIWVRLTNAIEDTVDNMTLEDLKVKYLKRKGNVT